jgi:3-oxoadipate enol-lactonase
VLIHSLGMDRSFWNAVTPALAQATAVLLYDCRGHGQSDKPKGPYRIERFAHDLADLMDGVGWRSAVIAGASMGGCVTLAFAAAYPARAAALGLFDTTARYDAPDKWEERALAAETKGLGALVEFQTTRWFTDAFRASRKDVVDASVATFLANSPRAYADTCRMLGACDLTAALPRLTMPVRIAVGEEDYATPVAMAEVLHRGIAGSTLTIIENARHLTPLEAADRIVAELRALIETVPAQ